MLSINTYYFVLLLYLQDSLLTTSSRILLLSVVAYNRDNVKNKIAKRIL